MDATTPTVTAGRVTHGPSVGARWRRYDALAEAPNLVREAGALCLVPERVDDIFVVLSLRIREGNLGGPQIV